MIVILTEKPSVARDIAAHLGAKQRMEGYIEGNGYQVTWAFGHLIALKDPDEYRPELKKWSLATLPFIPEQFELKVVADKGVGKQFSIIKKLFKGAKEIICATDAGREGELIFRYIQQMASSGNKPWKRLWLTSLTEEAITNAFAQIKPGRDFDNLFAAARCRSEADWIVGLNATRNFSVRYGGGKILWSVGRVQTPVLALIVKRDDEIRYFKVESFWELYTKYRGVAFKSKSGRFSDKQSAEALMEQVKGHPFIIDKITSKKENEQPPQLYDLTELQRDMNRRYGMTAADTLQHAQALYEQKFITYPRTDSRYLTNDLKKQVVATLSQLKKYKEPEIAALNLTDLLFSSRIFNDKKVSDHHAIIPSGHMPRNLPLPLQSIYEAIVTRLIAVFYPPCVKEQTTIDGYANSQHFQAKGVCILAPGWTVLYPKKNSDGKDKAKEKDNDTCADELQELPSFVKGESGLHAPYVREGKTKPPPHYTENALLGAMETCGKLVEDEALKEALKEKGIGTPATRASIIETLLKRKYIQRNGKAITASDLGRYLIALIQDPNLKSAELTGGWEAKLKEIERGTYHAAAFMEQIVQFTKQLILESDISRIDYNIFGACPKCKSAVIKGKKGFGCSKWREGCSFVLWKQYKDIELNDGHVRCLLQKHIVPQPIGNAILTLSSHGEIQEIPLPAEEGNRTAVYKKRRAAAK